MNEQPRFRRAEDELLRRIRAREVVCGIIGLGYVGLPLAVQLAKSGYRVLGFDVTEKNTDDRGIGIVGMQERATLIGARLDIESKPGEGTSVYLRMPLSRQ